MVVVYFVLILTGIVTVHELGHYFFARLFKVKVLEFAFGFGPKLFSVKGKETVFRFNVFPIGGYVRMLGEEGEVVEEMERSFYGKPAWQRLLITLAGPLFSILAGYLLFVPITLRWGINLPGIDRVLPNSPAEEAGLMPGDVVYSVNDKIAFDTSVVSREVEKGKTLKLVVARDGHKVTLWVTPRIYPPTRELFLESAEGDPRGRFLEVKNGEDLDSLKDRINEYVVLLFEGGEVKGILKSFVEVPARYMIGISFSGLSPIFQRDFDPFKVGDRIVEVEGQSVGSWSDLVELYQRVVKGQGSLMVRIQGEEVSWWRGLSGETMVKVVGSSGEERLVVVEASVLRKILETPGVLKVFTTPYKPAGFLEVLTLSLKTCNYVLVTTISSLKNFFSNVRAGQIVGVVGIAGVIGQAAKTGMEAVLTLVAVITISLGVINLMPLPALDGGRIVFSLLEIVTRKRVDPKLENVIHLIGFVLLMVFFVYITFLDIGRLLGM